MSYDVRTGLVAYYKFDGASEFDGVAGHVFDNSLYANHGRALFSSGGSLPVIINGKLGRAGLFVLANKNYIQTPASPLYLASAINVSYSFWINQTTLTPLTKYRGIAAEGNVADACMVYIDSRNTVGQFGTGWPACVNAVVIYLRTSGGKYSICANNALPNTGGWYHVSVTYNGTTGCIYVNGVPQTTVLSQTYKATGNIAPLNSTWQIGCLQSSEVNGVNNLDAAIDDFRVYKRALSGDEVAALYDLRYQRAFLMG